MSTTLAPDFSDVTSGSSTVAIASDIPGAGPALTWLRNKLGEWDTTATRIAKMQHDAAQLAYIAQQQGNTGAADELQRQIYRLGDLAAKRAQAADTLAPVRDWLRSQGFGFVPLIVAGAAVLAITAVAYVISQTSIEEQQLDFVAKGILTPEQYQALKKQQPALFNFDLGKLVPVALIGVGGWLLVRWIQGKGHGAQDWR